MFAGTCAEYYPPDGNCIEDQTPLGAQSLYAENKLGVRDAAFSPAETTELEVAWARVFFSFGPFERPERLVPSVIRALLVGDRASCRDGDLVRDFMYVRDVANAMVAVLDHAFCGDINIASGSAMTIEALVNRIACRLNAKDRVDFKKRSRRSDDPPEITADISRLRDTIAWTPRYDLDSAIDETIAWWRNQAA